MENDKSYRGWLRQIPIYLGKCFRAFIYMDDWKVIPMAVIIGGMVSLVACQNIFVTMEGTTSGGFAMVCVCIWNGFFNSIQVICRERDVVKREHRSGMHISSYIGAHMIYQAFICLLQVAIIILTAQAAGVCFPSEGIITPYFKADFGITLFLITYAADMLSLMISAIVTNSTAAMTVMPFVMIIQLVCSGIMFTMSGDAAILTNFTISNWGMRALCSVGNFNSLPMVSLWNQIFKYRSFEIGGIKPIEAVTNYMMDNHLQDQFMLATASYSTNEKYLSTPQNVLLCWEMLIVMALAAVLIAGLFLKNIDKDKR